MNPAPESHVTASNELADPPRRQACPACGGVLVPLGSVLRCSRCSFAICEGCGAGNWQPWSAGDQLR